MANAGIDKNVIRDSLGMYSLSLKTDIPHSGFTKIYNFWLKKGNKKLLGIKVILGNLHLTCKSPQTWKLANWNIWSEHNLLQGSFSVLCKLCDRDSRNINVH